MGDGMSDNEIGKLEGEIMSIKGRRKSLFRGNSFLLSIFLCTQTILFSIKASTNHSNNKKK
jgi:hypothetical protein